MSFFSKYRFAAPFTGVLALGAACGIDEAPQGLKATPPGTGPEVIFDLERRPLPEIPIPNDVATIADATSRTGRRINVSLVAPTHMEQRARDGFGEMEGWGTFAPITVAFERGLTADAGDPAIDLDNVKARMQGDGYDFSNDPVYVINLTTGVPVPLDMGNGNFPQPMRDLDAYWPNDLKAKEQNILFETIEEGSGLTQADYTPALDRDFDGVLDHPNTLGTLGASQIDGLDNLLTWYERETDTLIMKPVLPMDEKTEYAVILTDRLKGTDGKPVRSPFPYAHHPTQASGVAKVRALLASSDRKAYYGDLAGTGLDHVAFAWTFTTQPVYEDMRLLRDGLYGRGPFARFRDQFPPKATAFRAVGLSDTFADEPAGFESDPRCAPHAGHPYIIKIEDAKSTIHQLLQRVYTLPAEQERVLEESLDNIDHLVIGTFPSPYLLGDPLHEDPDQWFHLNFMTGEGRAVVDQVPFWLAVPKVKNGATQPFPTTVWAHGTSLHADEIIVRAGYFAKQGIATLGIDMPGHGLYLDAGTRLIAEAFLRDTCMIEWINGITASRAEDVNGDGIPDSGGLLWTSHIFHSRDNIRQSVLDEMQTVRVLQSFDGTARSDQDFNHDGAPDLAGDFDGDGVPDVGGAARVFTSGNSYGGILAQIHGALDPFVVASAPISGGGGLMDVATRSSLVPTSVVEQVMSPLLVAVPSATRPQATRCAADQSSVRLVVNDLLDSREIEVACLSASELAPKMTVVLANLTNKEVRCARTSSEGTFRVPIPASVGDRLDVQIYTIADAVDSYKTCAATDAASAFVGRHIATWEQPALTLTQVGDPSKTCDGDGGCAQFRDAFYPIGSPLVAPQEGLGLSRQTPEVRRLFNLTQAAVDPADPINFAASYMLRPLPGLDGENLGPRPILTSNTVGDPYVPVATGNAFARAAGALPFLPPSALVTFPEYADFTTPQVLYDAWGGTPNDLLIDHHVIEGIARLKREHADAACGVNFLTPSTAACGAAPSPDPATCASTLFDADHLSEGADHYGAPFPRVPLRLARIASLRALASGDPRDALGRSWAPRIGALGDAPKDGSGWDAPTIGLVNAYINPLGQHVWVTGDPCKAFDESTYFDTMLVHFLATSGRDVYFLSHPESHHCMARQDCPFE